MFAALHGPSSCFTRFHQVLGWSSCLRSPTNRHAVGPCDLVFHWTFKAIRTFILQRVHGASFSCLLAPFSLENMDFWVFSATGSPHLNALRALESLAKHPVSATLSIVLPSCLAPILTLPISNALRLLSV